MKDRNRGLGMQSVVRHHISQLQQRVSYPDWLFNNEGHKNYEYATSSKVAFDWAGNHGQAPNEEGTQQSS
jgi:hypothetical protein